MTTSPIVFGGTIPQNYEDLLGPFIFEPFAVDLSRQLDLANSNDILELACGSGRLTKHILDKLPSSARFIASDLNKDMISVAQSKIRSAHVTWALVDMQTIPYPDNEFDTVVCQFGVMLVPDQMKALSEIFRILKPGGKLFFITWAPMSDNPLWTVASKVLNTFLDEHPIQTTPGPFAMSDESAVLDQLKTAGFHNATVSSINNTAQINTAADAAKGIIEGLPVYSAIMAKAPQLITQISETMATEFAKQLGDEPMQTPQKAWFFTAKK